MVKQKGTDCLQDIAGDVQVGVASMQTYNPLATNASWPTPTWGNAGAEDMSQVWTGRGDNIFTDLCFQKSKSHES